MGSTQDWIIFNLVVIALILADFFVFHRKEQKETLKSAVLWSLFWIGISVAFGAYVWTQAGRELGYAYFTAYVIEKSLSVDNLFVFLLIFQHFKIRSEYQHKALLYGIAGAIIMRGFFIIFGISLLGHFHVLFLLFGLLLIYSGIKMFTDPEDDVEPENALVLWFKSKFDYKEDYQGGDLFTIVDGKRFITPIFITVVALESSDLIFAVDSVPAVIACTDNLFIAYTSNIMAILGLRALYFCLAFFADKLTYLNKGLGAILIFIGVKMMLHDYYHIPIETSLSTIGFILAISIILSLLVGAQNNPTEDQAEPDMLSNNKEETSTHES